MTPKYRDFPPRGLAWLTSVLATTAFATAGGFALGFLALVYVGVAGVELDPMAWGSGVLGTMLRGTVGLAFVGVMASLGLGAFLSGANRLLYVRQLAREAEASPTVVAAWQGRRLIVSTSPFIGVTAFACWGIGLGVLAIILFLAVSGEPSSDGFDVWIAIAIAGAVVVAMIGLLVHVSVVWRPAWDDAVARMFVAWGHAAGIPWSSEDEATAEDAESEEAAAEAAAKEAAAEVAAVGVLPAWLKRIATWAFWVGAGAGAVGGATFLIAGLLGQPCRACDGIRYEASGGVVIDLVMGISALLTVLATAVFVLASLIEWIEDVVLQTRLARRVRDGLASPPETVLARALTAPWPGSTAGMALVVVGLGIGGVFAFAEIAAPGILQPQVAPMLLAIGVVGVLVVAWSVGAESRSRNRLREAWSLGDLWPPASPSRLRRTTTVSDAPE